MERDGQNPPETTGHSTDRPEAAEGAEAAGGNKWERSPLGGKTRLGAWMRWIAFMQGLILLLAIIGPGRRRRPSRREEAHGMFARWFMDDPNWFEATAVNFVLMNVGVFAILLLAWGVTKWRRRKRV